MLGTFALSAGYYDAYYLKAQKVRTLIRQDFEKAFENCDALITPVSPTTAFRIGEKITNPARYVFIGMCLLSRSISQAFLRFPFHAASQTDCR
jgi:aspartyl-tRNA(Asn)/glutamyl-tRNA(Gln) amidotransferase subunit A